MVLISVLAAVPALATVAFAQSGPFNPCPLGCSKAGHDPSAWTHLHGEGALKRCNQTVLFDTAIHVPVNAPDAHVTFRTCMASEADTEQPIEYSPAPFTFGDPDAPAERRRDGSSSGGLKGCVEGASTYRNATKAVVQRWNPGGGEAAVEQVLSATTELESWLASEADCGSSIMFALAGEAVVGLHVGAEIHKPSVTKLIRMFTDSVRENPAAERAALQVCKDQTPKTWSFGIFADTRGNISSVQEALRSWSVAQCLSGSDQEQLHDNVEVEMVRATDVPVVLGLSSGFEQEGEPLALRRDIQELVPRADCRAIEVVAGDGCWSLAQRCGISQTDLERYNSGVSSFCNSLKPGQYICCSSGTLPDLSPKPNPDGSCASYAIVKDDTCFDIAAKYGVTVIGIHYINRETWGWAGCSAIQPGQKICLSVGSPPMPAAISNAVCGPQVDGTQPPAAGTALASLNPCPLNVCCNVWAQCGTTVDFCTEAPASSGNPGTTQPGKNSCISNCGMDMVNNGSPPASFARIAYFEAWNKNRRCLHMDVTDIDKTTYTHIHFAFVDITPDYQIDVSKHQAQFDMMKGMSGIKRVVSFGGWAFSTEAPTYNIFRDGVTAENRAKLSTNVYNFVVQHGLDGADFDWEYPAAPDLPREDPGVKQEGEDYLEFLKAVKRRFRGTTKTVSIAAPASYWYMKGYPMKEIGAVVDYIIYMTYDLHGQWDYQNKWSSPGCPDGNCLRSHVNLTETTNALVMITKAGIPANKVIVGVTSYGRSFKMAEAGCVGDMCRFLGKESQAAKGYCTDTAGYISNAEIRDIILDAQGFDPSYTAMTYHNHASSSDILVYNDLEWVAYMTDVTKATRTEYYRNLNFGGVSDWAVDLDRDWGASGVGEAEDGGIECDYSLQFDSLEALEAAAGMYHEACKVVYVLNTLSKMLRASVAGYNDVNNGYDDKFNSYRGYMNQAMPYQLKRWAHWEGPDGVSSNAEPHFGQGQQYFNCKFNGEPGHTYDGPCPVPDDVVGNRLTGFWDLEMTLRDSAGFDSALASLGMDREWIEFGEHKQEIKCQPTSGGGTGPCVDFELIIQGFPKLKPTWEMPNPKKIMQEAIKNLANLEDSLTAAILEISFALWEGNNAEVAQVLSMPVFLMTQAVDAMSQAKEVGQDIQDAQNKDLILTIITAVLFFVPFLGELAAAAAGLVRLARVFAAVGAVSDFGMTIADLVENPEAAPMAIAGLMFAGKIKSPKEYGTAAASRRAMTDAARAGAGQIFKKHDDQLNKIVPACRRT